jgi:hypothetical protein
MQTPQLPSPNSILTTQTRDKTSRTGQLKDILDLLKMSKKYQIVERRVEDGFMEISLVESEPANRHVSPPSISPIYIAKIPPIRTPLGSISGNRLKGSKISLYIHGQVKGQATRGANQIDIAKDLKLTLSTVLQYTYFSKTNCATTTTPYHENLGANRTPIPKNNSSSGTSALTQSTLTNKLSRRVAWVASLLR